MEKKIFGKTLVIGLIILFVGASVLPGVGGKINKLEQNVQPSSMADNWYENFDSYALESSMHGQGGWKGWDNDPTWTGYVTDDQYHSSPHSLESAGDTDLVHPFEGYSSGVWTFKTWCYVPSEMTGQSYFILQSYYEDFLGQDNKWALQVHFDATEGKVVAEHEGEELALITDQWVEIRVEIDLDIDWFECYYDDDLLQEKEWTADPNNQYSGILNIGAVDIFASGASAMYFDDFSLEGEGSGEPDLACEGDLRWENVSASSALNGEFIVRNIGGSGSLLGWEITDNPSWGQWTFTPSSGDDLTPEDGDFTVVVDVIAPPDANQEYNGKVRVENKEDPDDFCEIVVFISTPRSRTLESTLLSRILETFPNAFPVLRYVLGL